MLGSMCFRLMRSPELPATTGPGHEVLRLQGQRFAANLPGEPGPKQQTDDNYDVLQ